MWWHDAAKLLSSHGLMLKSYALRGSMMRGPACVAYTSTGHECRTDLPLAAGGTNRAAQPVELLLAALLGCKTATAHYVARHLWPRPHHRIDALCFSDIVAHRDERGALALPIAERPPVPAALVSVRGVATVTPRSSGVISAADVRALGAIVEERCPVADTLVRAGCVIDIEWRLGLAEAS